MAPAPSDTGFGVNSFISAHPDIVAGKNFKKKNRTLKGLNQALNTFSYITSHDLQEPLRKIQTFSSRIIEKEEKNLSDKGKEYFNRVQLAANRMQHMIDDLLILSSLTTDKVIKRKKLTEILHKVLEEYKPQIEAKKAFVDTSGVESICNIPIQMQLLFDSLVNNSLKFAHPSRPLGIIVKSRVVKGTRLHVKSLASQKKYCHITYSDNGIGFEPKFSDKIFEVFQRLHAKDEYEGTGIGLAICKKIIENHKGLITAKGEPGQGATFEIYLPLE